MMINPIKVAILCGGKATRLGPLTTTMPKSLVEVAGEPFIFHQLRLLREQGFNRVVLCVGNFGGMIRDVIGDGDQLGMDIEYSWDGEHPLGTGGAVKKAIPKLGDEFMVMYGDSYLPVDYHAVIYEFKKVSKWVRVLMTKYKGVDYGIGVFKQNAFDPFLDDATFSLNDVYEWWSVAGLPFIEMPERFMEIGSPQGLEEVRNKLSVATNASA